MPRALKLHTELFQRCGDSEFLQTTNCIPGSDGSVKGESLEIEMREGQVWELGKPLQRGSHWCLIRELLRPSRGLGARLHLPVGLQSCRVTGGHILGKPWVLPRGDERWNYFLTSACQKGQGCSHVACSGGTQGLGLPQAPGHHQLHLYVDNACFLSLA